MAEEIKNTAVTLRRNLDGKGRLMLPGELREAAGFRPDEPVEIRLAQIEQVGKNGYETAFIITRQEGGATL